MSYAIELLHVVLLCRIDITTLKPLNWFLVSIARITSMRRTLSETWTIWFRLLAAVDSLTRYRIRWLGWLSISDSEDRICQSEMSGEGYVSGIKICEPSTHPRRQHNNNNQQATSSTKWNRSILGSLGRNIHIFKYHLQYLFSFDFGVQCHKTNKKTLSRRSVSVFSVTNHGIDPRPHRCNHFVSPSARLS